MNKNIIKITLITTIMFFGVFFTNIDSAKADIPFCKVTDEYKTAASCEYTGSGFSDDGNVMKTKIIFAQTKDDSYCAEVESSNVATGWANIVDAHQRGKVAFDLADSTIKNGLKSCPKLKLVNDYEILNKKTTKFTVSDKDMDSPCAITELVSFGSECWVSNGENFTKITPEELKKIIADSDSARQNVEGKADIDKIIEWGKTADKEYVLNAEDSKTCAELLGNYKLKQFLNNLFWIISIIGIILLIIMTAIEFIKVITGQDDNNLKDAFKHTVIRGICVIVLLLLPVIISAIITVVNNNNEYYLTDKNGNIINDNKGKPIKLSLKIGDNNQPLCGIGEND